MLESLFSRPVKLVKNQIFYKNHKSTLKKNQHQTKEIFSDKWKKVDKDIHKEDTYNYLKDWFLKLYGFKSEIELKEFLKNKKFIIDAGCGTGYKTAWFAELAPHATVIGIDISDSLNLAAKNYPHIKNLFFLKGDISDTGLNDNSIDFTICDQVIMHTENPKKTFDHLTSVTKKNGEFACYVYRKKALPRELLDEYFRTYTHSISEEKLWEMSKQLTELGEQLTKLDVKFISPDIPLLGIKGGEYDIQRFLYWNFLKCFWKEEWSTEMSNAINFDWYAPSNAKRYSKDEFIELINSNNLKIISFYEEEACYSGRFKK